jgi:hypothetical protein
VSFVVYGSYPHRETEPLLPSTSSLFEAMYHQIAMLGGRTNEQWIAQYAGSHQNPMNRVCHTLGIPAIVVSIGVLVLSIFVHRLWVYALALFLVGGRFNSLATPSSTKSLNSFTTGGSCLSVCAGGGPRFPGGRDLLPWHAFA